MGLGGLGFGPPKFGQPPDWTMLLEGAGDLVRLPKGSLKGSIGFLKGIYGV